jgi:hypothetical protein
LVALTRLLQNPAVSYKLDKANCHYQPTNQPPPPQPTNPVFHSQFNELYEKAIDGSERANLPSKRIANILEHMTYEIYLWVMIW